VERDEAGAREGEEEAVLAPFGSELAKLRAQELRMHASARGKVVGRSSIDPGSIGDVVTFTQRAREALERSAAAARRLNPAALVRIAPDGRRGVQAELTDGVRTSDELVEVMPGTTVIVARGVSGLIDAGEHDALELRDLPGED
jgi:hypothetical protein